VRKENRIGRDKYHRIMKSLRLAGYVHLVVERSELDGTIVCVRYIVRAIPKDSDPAIPGERVDADIESAIEAADGPDEPASPAGQDPESVASLQQPEKPDVDCVRVSRSPGYPESGKAGRGQSNDILENTPPTPQQPPAARPQEARRALPTFAALCAKWPSDRIIAPSAAEKRFRRMNEAQQQAAFDSVERYVAAQRAKGWKICDLQTYLRDRRFETVKGAPADATIVRAGTPQAYRWLEYRRAMGEPTSFLEELFRAGRPATFPTEWPPPLPASAKAS
jgi:hypothetical protein